jgi:hypothetical protein
MAGYRKHRGMDPADEARFLQVGRGVTVSHSTTGFEKTRRRSMSYANTISLRLFAGRLGARTSIGDGYSRWS